MKTILVLGASGFIGQKLCSALSPTYEVYGTYYLHPLQSSHNPMIRLDISIENQITNLLETIEPDYIISSLRGNHSKQLILHQRLVDYIQTHSCHLLYLSSISVYDAITDKPHTESDPTNSSSDYGQFKISCEKLLSSQLNNKVTIIRFPMIFSKDSESIRLLTSNHKKHLPIPVYQNLYINLTSDVLLIEQLIYIINTNITGIIHLGSQDIIGYAEVIAILVKALKLKSITYDYQHIREHPFYIALKSEYSILPEYLLKTSHQILDTLTL